MREFKWYVLRVVSGKEKKIKLHIESELEREKMSELINQIIIPMEKTVQLKNNKKVFKERNTFPGYIMIEGDLHGELISVIKSVTDVLGFLPPKRDPEPMRLSEINKMLGIVDQMNNAGATEEIPFLREESVKVIDGPFNGFTGVIQEINEEKKKLIVIVKIFGRSTPVELNYMQVEREV
ncbi:MAG: transcription termination/antitermination protein NusG [Bacteroidota bacterium]|nr:transcription termination/antitermination protein NusG [Bacteroidota bacterium]